MHIHNLLSSHCNNSKQQNAPKINTALKKTKKKAAGSFLYSDATQQQKSVIVWEEPKVLLKHHRDYPKYEIC